MSATGIQALLRFLTQDAKIPLGTAMANVKAMQNAQVATIEDIAKATFDGLKAIFLDEKLAKQILSAAKRISKKRAAGEDELKSSNKRRRDDFDELNPPTPAEYEKSLELPESNVSDEELYGTVLHTNRAPVVLAFALAVLRHTMPEQPPSSRFSLAQAVVSMNSRSKAINIGLEKGTPADEEGWGQGQPTVKVMTREIRVLKRWGYDWSPTKREEDTEGIFKRESQERGDVQAGGDSPALFAIDLEQLKQLNGPLTFAAAPGQTKGLPIYQPEGARSYLLRSFDLVTKPADTQETAKPKKPTAAARAAEHEKNAGMLLKVVDLLCQSWDGVLDKEELDRRAWSWYVKVRPEVEAGVSGWGAKGVVRLADILDLRRKESPSPEDDLDDADLFEQMTAEEFEELEQVVAQKDPAFMANAT